MPVMVDQDMPAMVSRLADVIPQNAKEHGWNIGNLSHRVEVTPFGAEERWSVDFYQPSVYTDWRQMAGRPPRSVLRTEVREDRIEAASPDELVDLLTKIVEMFGLGDLRPVR